MRQFYPFRYVPFAALGLSISLARFAPAYSIQGSPWKTFPPALAALAFLYFLWAIYIYPRFISPLRVLPTAPGASFWNGHFTEIVSQPTGRPMLHWQRTVPNQGLVRYFFLLHVERVLLLSPRAIGDVTTTKIYDFKKPDQARDLLGPLLGIGLVLAEGEEHRIQRKNLNPAFQFRHVQNLVPVFWSKAVEMVRLVTKEVEASTDPKGPLMNLSDWLSRCTLDIIGLAGMGHDFDSLERPNNDLNKAYRIVFQRSRASRILFLLALILPLSLLRALPLQRNRDVKEAARTIRGVAKKVLDDKQRKLAAKESTDKDILNVALESGAFSPEDLVNQMMTFLAAGHETTATSSQWALVCLARHPDVQSRLRAEIRSKLPSIDSQTPVTADLLEQLPYLSAVCNEVLRFYPPVPLTRREALRDTTVDGNFIPKGAHVLLVPAATNFNVDFWGEDADVFNPDRWLGEKRANTGGATSNYANMTFMHGPRSCIGQGFAKAEFQCIMAAVIGRFEFIMDPPDREFEILQGIVQRPKDPLIRTKVVPGW